MTQEEKVLYTAKFHSTGGRDGRGPQFRWPSRHQAFVSGPGQRHQSGATICRRLVGLLHRRNGACGLQNEGLLAGRSGHRCRSRLAPG